MTLLHGVRIESTAELSAAPDPAAFTRDAGTRAAELAVSYVGPGPACCVMAVASGYWNQPSTSSTTFDAAAVSRCQRGAVRITSEKIPAG